MKMSLVPPLECCHAGTCLPDYWGGHHLPHIAIVAYPKSTMRDIKRALHAELNAGEVAGNDPATWDYSGELGDVWYKRVHAAINKMKPANKGQRTFFGDLESVFEEDSDYFVYAYFVFMPE
jgi:hypothetical protein